jgi:hypothetical protein
MKRTALAHGVEGNRREDDRALQRAFQYADTQEGQRGPIAPSNDDAEKRSDRPPSPPRMAVPPTTVAAMTFISGQDRRCSDLMNRTEFSNAASPVSAGDNKDTAFHARGIEAGQARRTARWRPVA